MEPDSHRNRKKALYSTIAVIVGMFGLAYGSVPLYDLFCRVTGFAGTTRVAVHLPEKILSRKVTVRFNADVSQDMPWTFTPEQTSVEVKIGEEKLAFFEARNNAKVPITGTAVYNVTPMKTGEYFNKVQCFCFSKQTIKPGETIRFPVSFFIDPALADDPNMDDVSTITLSYSFFRVKGS